MRVVLFAILLICALSSCKPKTRNYSTFSGIITEPNSDSLEITGQEKTYKKVIKLNKDGSFSDTISLNQSFATVFDGTESTILYFKNGFDLNMTINTLEFDETVSFTGKGANTNKKIVDYILFQEELINNSSYFDLSKEKFNESINQDIDVFMTQIETNTNLDSIFINRFENSFKNLKEVLNKEFDEKNKVN